VARHIIAATAITTRSPETSSGFDARPPRKQRFSQQQNLGSLGQTPKRIQELQNSALYKPILASDAAGQKGFGLDSNFDSRFSGRKIGRGRLNDWRRNKGRECSPPLISHSTIT